MVELWYLQRKKLKCLDAGYIVKIEQQELMEMDRMYGAQEKHCKCTSLFHLSEYKSFMKLGTSLVVQGLRLYVLNAQGPGFDPWSGN